MVSKDYNYKSDMPPPSKFVWLNDCSYPNTITEIKFENINKELKPKLNYEEIKIKLYEAARSDAHTHQESSLHIQQKSSLHIQQKTRSYIQQKAKMKMAADDLKILAAYPQKNNPSNCQSCGRSKLDHPAVYDYSRPSINEECPFKFVDLNK